MCPFCNPAPGTVIAESDSWRIIRDAHPVTPGHTLVIPRAHVVPGQWLNAAELFGVAYQHGRSLRTDFNVGMNFGAAAGQSVQHLHIHVIPRRAGDHTNPRGGVRAVIPGKADY